MRGPLAITVLLLACILAAGILYVRQAEKDVARFAAEHVEAIADQKLRMVATWRDERLSDASTIGAHSLVARAASQARIGPASTRELLLEWCRSWLAHRQYRTVAVFDAAGTLLAFAGPVPEEVHVPEGLALHDPMLSDLHEDVAGTIHVDLLVPLFLAERGGARRVGLAMLRAEPVVGLFPLIQPWPGPSHSGQILLARRKGDAAQVLPVTRLRGVVAVPEELPLARADLPAVRAARGEYDLGGAVDSLGERVLATARPIPGTSWALVLHIDEEEVYRSVRARTPWVLALCAALSLAAVAGVHLWWRRRLEAFRDEQHQGELERLALERHFSYLSRHANDIQLLADEGLRIVDANDRAVAAYGYDREELFGKPIQDLLAPRARIPLDSRFRAAVAGRREVFESVHLRRDGRSFPVEMSASIIEVEGERYYSSVISDVTEQKSSERALRRSEDRLRLALEATALGIWDWDVRRDELYLSPNLLETLGDSRKELHGGEAIRHLLHSGDFADASQQWDALLKGERLQFEARMRVRTGAGDWRWVLHRFSVVERSEAGRPLRIVGTLADVGYENGR